MSSNDYFRFVTQELVKKMVAPKQEKKQKEKEKHQLHGKWFGVLPFAFKLFFRSRKK
ncbi:YqzE family protein [Terribacillus goriensis]|uniref:YqzE family protein n=1 Tax=Terribacillus saccharophilus TaxID=361277 RepID=UPI0039833464